MGESPVNILLVEDEEAHAELVRRAFEARGDRVQLIIADRLSKAREQIKSGALPDLIIADWRLPDGEGMELLSSNSSGARIPVVIMTSHGNEKVAVEAMKLGALDYIVKSEATLADMPHIAERALREWLYFTERQRVEKALRENEERFRLLAENARDLIYRYRVLPTPCYEYVSPSVTAITGYTPDEHYANPSLRFEIVHPDDRPLLASLQQSRLAFDEPLVLRWYHKNGSLIWIEQRNVPVYDEAGQLLAIEGVARDITAHKQTEEALRRRNRELALLNRAALAFGSTLDLDQVLATVLEEVNHLLGVLASSVWLIDPETSQLICRQATGPQSEIVRGWRLESGQGLVGWVARQGESLVVSNAATDTRHIQAVDQHTGLQLRSFLSVPLRAHQGVIGVLQVMDTQTDRFSSNDLTLVELLAATAAIAIENARMFTEEKARVTALADALAQQQELDRMKDAFVQNVSHELRTPLTIAYGYVALLNSGELGELQEIQREPVMVVARRLKLLTELVDDLKTILEADTQQIQTEAVNLSEIVRKLVVDFQVAAEKAGLTLHTDVEPDLPAALGDSTHLHRVLDNLLSNALKFTPAGGQISVRLRQAEQNLVMEVADTGIGIPEDKLDRVFERFYQVDGRMSRRYGGTGLGLALVKEVVESNGGTVKVTSRPGQGSTFTVTLPVASSM